MSDLEIERRLQLLEEFMRRRETDSKATAFGTYTPTLTGVANVDGSTAYVCGYYRVGNSVTVYGRVDIDPTAAASTATRLGVSLPIASNFAAAGDCGGAGYSPGVVSLGFAVEADSTNDRAQITFLSTTTANTGFRFTFTYLVA